MSSDRIEIQEAPEVTPFILISTGLHIGVWLLLPIIALLVGPCDTITEKKFPPVKVKYIPQKVPTFVDSPKPRKVETPQNSELIARYDSRAHSNRSPKKNPSYQNKKTSIPKTKKSVAQKPPSIPKKKEVPAPTKTKQPFRPYDKGVALPKNQGEVSNSSPPKQITGGTLALLDGFDPEKYAALDTESETTEDDGEAISLDTRESRYASYFARIKRQIEQVWQYPNDAQRKGITGELTLRFQISRDGNLMNVRLINGSGYNVLDEAALQAVKSAAPYYPFPVTIDRETLPIRANFIYSPKPGAQYFPPR